jgi:hypothetical protein
MSTDMSDTADQTQIDAILNACQQVKEKFDEKYSDVVSWMQQHDISFEDIRLFMQQLLAATSLAGAVAMNTPVNLETPHAVEHVEAFHDDSLVGVSVEEQEDVMKKLESIVQMPPGHMDHETELYLEQQLSDILGFEVTAELEGKRLNHSIGIMGGEQHLKRYPSDTLDQHDSYTEAGIAPNRGAFGWFTENGELTEKAVQREKYYFAVQTLYLPTWNSEHNTLKQWYKFRKMIVINPVERVAVVGVVGDAGPAAWVKKQFGGSPEIIREGKVWSPRTRGRIILLFVDDPNDTIPLGPISLEAVEKLEK